MLGSRPPLAVVTKIRFLRLMSALFGYVVTTGETVVESASASDTTALSNGASLVTSQSFEAVHCVAKDGSVSHSTL